MKTDFLYEFFFIFQLYLNVFKAMLQTCESKQLSSVAMPALGTGNLKYPRDEVCKTMFSAIDNWVRDNPSTCLRNVRFVMHVKDRDVIQVCYVTSCDVCVEVLFYVKVLLDICLEWLFKLICMFLIGSCLIDL